MRKLIGLMTVALVVAGSVVSTIQGQAPPRGPVVIGPPAPVPPEVAMLRPTVEELASINATIQKLIDTDRSDAAPLLKKYQSLMLVQPPRINTAATYTQTTLRMGPRHERFVEIAKAG